MTRQEFKYVIDKAHLRLLDNKDYMNCVCHALEHNSNISLKFSEIFEPKQEEKDAFNVGFAFWFGIKCDAGEEQQQSRIIALRLFEQIILEEEY